MLYRFHLTVIWRVLLIAALTFGIVVGYNYEYYLLTAFAVLALVLTVFGLIRYVDQTNRDIAQYFESIRYNDFTTTASAASRGESFRELYKGFHLINRKFQEVRADQEANHQFLQTIVEHIEVGLLCFNEAGEVNLMNKALQRLLRKSFLLHIDGLRPIDETLWATVKRLQAGERELVKVNVDNKLMQLAVQATELSLNREKLHLVSVQNIQSELEAQEVAAWQKLIRILTHEIMNSVAPIASLSATIKDMLGNGHAPNGETMQTVKQSVSVIQRRSEGLLDFTETYRSLTRIPPPNFQPVDGAELLREVETLFRAEIREKNISLSLHLPPSAVQFQGDPNLLEQVLINLVRNAIDALNHTVDPTLHLHLSRGTGSRAHIQVADNGPGIPPDKLEQIFIPFYTTKPQGSGIGLSLSRQIMGLHKGSIEVQSAEGAGTVVTLTI